MSMEQKVFNIDQVLNKLYEQRNKLMIQMKQKPEAHKFYIKYSNLVVKIREQWRLRRECQDEVSGKRLRVWLKAEHPEVYDKFFGSEKGEIE